MTSTNDRSVEHLLRDLTPQVLGALTRRHRDFAAAEDATQEALLAASTQWPLEGVPDNPGGWLYKIALRRLSDHARSEVARRRREERLADELAIEQILTEPAEPDFDPDQDDTLALLFMCCHPSLTTPSAIALTLRAVGGLTTAEIAKAFFVPEATMAQRISRAKQAIKDSNIPFSLPAAEEREERLDAVMQVLYLIFNEGYTSSGGENLQRVDLATEAIRLTRALKDAVTDSAEVVGLLALMLLTEARSAARSGPAGELIPLDEQDRTRWDQALIQEGVALSAQAMSSTLIGPYQLQAAIAALHDRAETAAHTDWAQIQSLYGLLARLGDNPMVALNHAVATAMVEGVDAGLRLVDTIAQDARLKDHYRIHAVRAHLYERAGERQLALEHYRRAADGTSSLPERNYLMSKAARLRHEPVFAEAWQARAFALALKLSERGHFTQNEWTTALARQLRRAADAGQPDDGSHYYDHWLAALEALVVEKAMTTKTSLDTRKEEWRESYLRTPHGKPVELKRSAG